MNQTSSLLRGSAVTLLCLLALAVQAGGTIETIVVDSAADNAVPGTLRQAILDANGSAANEVRIDIDLPDGSEILLGSDLPILSHPNVRVANSAPSRQIAVDGALSYRIFRQVASNATLWVQDIELRDAWMNAGGGFDGGACLYTQGRALLYHVRFAGCQAINGSGAAVHALDNLLVEDSEFSGNAVIQDGSTPVSRGGAVYCDGTSCTIRRSTFADNQVSVQLAGQTERGGGAASLNAAQITVEDSRFLRNRGLGRGGALYVVPDQIGGFVDISGSLFRQNEGGEGGAIWIQSTADDQSLTVDRSIFDRNTATLRAPAIRTDVVAEVSLSGNVFHRQSSSNTAVAWGTVYLFANGTRQTQATLDFNTFLGEDDNSLLFQTSVANPGDVVVSRFHANVMDQRASRDACDADGPDLAPQSGAFNVVSDDTCTVSIESGSLIDVDPRLESAIFGTETLVYPRPSSPAIDLVTSETLVTCSGLADLDGTVRPLDGDDDGSGHCDAGAVERNVELFIDRFEG